MWTGEEISMFSDFQIPQKYDNEGRKRQEYTRATEGMYFSQRTGI